MYGIFPLGNVTEAFVWNHETLEEAKMKAEGLSKKYNIEIVVFKIIGTYRTAITWTPE